MSLDITPCEADLADLDANATTALPRATLVLMAAACGASAANLFYNQPLLGQFGSYFHATDFQAGLVATAAQVGYGVGLFFFVPLGDLVERRRLVLALSYLCVGLLVATAFSPNLWTLITLQLLVGVATMSPQLLIPLAVDLTPPTQRGRTIGALMTGLLIGVLLARTFAGFVGDWFGWRAMFGVAAAVMLVLCIALGIGLPRRAPSLRMSYGRLMHSMLELLLSQPALRTASVVSGISFGCFTAFWTALAFLMTQHFHRGSKEAGLFGIVGVIGALAAPLAGRLSDRRGPTFTVTVAIALTIAAFAIMWGWVTIAGLIVGVLLMDLGVQSVQVAEQATVMALVPEARSRINTLYMVIRFIGGAAGSAIGAAAWSRWRWPGVCCVACGMMGVAMVVHLAGARRDRRAGATAAR